MESIPLSPKEQSCQTVLAASGSLCSPRHPEGFVFIRVSTGGLREDNYGVKLPTSTWASFWAALRGSASRGCTLGAPPPSRNPTDLAWGVTVTMNDNDVCQVGTSHSEKVMEGEARQDEVTIKTCYLFTCLFDKYLNAYYGAAFQSS